MTPQVGNREVDERQRQREIKRKRERERQVGGGSREGEEERAKERRERHGEKEEEHSDISSCLSLLASFTLIKFDFNKSSVCVQCLKRERDSDEEIERK